MTQRLTRSEAVAYWENLHASRRQSLQAVCHPHRSVLVNGMMDIVQRSAIDRALHSLGVTLRGARAYDIGCGRGRWLRRFRDAGAAVAGMDVSPTAVDFCRKRGLDVTLGSVERLPASDASQDLVTSVTVLLHVDYELQARAATEMQRICRPGGVILLVEPTKYLGASHVWERSIDDWIRLFDGCDLVWAENHHFVPLLRRLWRTKVMRLPRPVVWIVEGVALAYSIPLEFALMYRYRGTRGRRGLHHVLAFRRRQPG
jgi:SAM-dependent methyltransferase